MRRRGQSIYKMMGAIIHGKICYLLLTKEIPFFFLQDLVNFVDILKVFIFRELLFKIKPIKSTILLANRSKVARAYSKSFFSRSKRVVCIF